MNKTTMPIKDEIFLKINNFVCVFQTEPNLILIPLSRKNEFYMSLTPQESFDYGNFDNFMGVEILFTLPRKNESIKVVFQQKEQQ